MQNDRLWYVDAADLAEMPFRQAADAWLASRTPYISTKTFHEYELNINTLAKFFGEMTPKQISADQIRMYQRMRAEVRAVWHQPRGQCFAATFEASRAMG
jgi:hypothetical protein